MCGDGKEKWKDSDILEAIKFGQDIERDMRGTRAKLFSAFLLGAFLGFMFAGVVLYV